MFKGRPVEVRYVVRLASAMAVYGVVFFLSRPYATAPASVSVRWVLAMLLALSTLGAVAAIARYLVEEDDEYLRARQVQAVLAGTGLTLAVYTLWGHLAAYGLARELPAYDIFPVFNACWLLATAVRHVLGR